jgi:peroxiredoxin
MKTKSNNPISNKYQMRKIVFTIVAALLLVGAQAQQRDGSMNMRQRMEELNSITDPQVLGNKLKTLLESESEGDQLLVYSYYMGKSLTAKAEETRKHILKKFPEGQLALQERIQEIEKLTDLEEKDARFRDLYQKYPNAGYGFLAFNIGREFAAKGDEEKMKFYADIYVKHVTDGKGNPITKESAYASMASGMVQVNPDAAATYLKYGVDETRASVDRMLAESNPNANLLMRAKNNHFSMLSSYLYALSNGQDAEKGYELAREAYESYKKEESTDDRIMNPVESVYAHTLIKTKRYKEALPLIEASVRRGDSGASVLGNLKMAYLAVNGHNADFETYKNNLLAERKQSFKDEVAKMAINQPAPDFLLKDVDGNDVRLSDYRGKVVVLDFWATWCGPCKASFPAMQKAVNKYKDDPNVKFLFLHTWEKGEGDPAKNAKSYIVDNNYTFTILMDLRDPKTNASAVASAYKVSGIPAKFVIDTNGNIRFSTSGFSPDIDKAVEELSNMIEFAKKS